MNQRVEMESSLNKEEKYKLFQKQIKELLADEEDLLACLSNFCAAYKDAFNPLWVGFYLVQDEELVVGPYQGPLACTRIEFGKGVCGCAWETGEVQIVPNVEEFKGHIACSSKSKSEIVLPVFDDENDVLMVLDIDSEMLSAFDEVDAKYLTELLELL